MVEEGGLGRGGWVGDGWMWGRGGGPAAEAAHEVNSAMHTEIAGVSQS